MDYHGHRVADSDHDDGVYDLVDDWAQERHARTPAAGPEQDDYGYHSGPAGVHVTGTQLRKRLITPEAVAAIHAEEPKKSLVQSLLGRVRKRG